MSLTNICIELAKEIKSIEKYGGRYATTQKLKDVHWGYLGASKEMQWKLMDVLQNYPQIQNKVVEIFKE